MKEENGGAEPLDKIASPDRSALKLMMDQEMAQAIYQAMEELPFQQRSAFTLRYLEGLSLDEIAESMELTTGAVKAHLWQAGQKMKEKLSGLLLIQEA